MLRVAMAGAAASLLTACSPDMDRFAPQATGAYDRTPVGTTLVPPTTIGGGGVATAAAVIPTIRSAPVSSIVSSPLPPVGAAVRPNYAAPAAASPGLVGNAARSALAAKQIPTGTARNLSRHGKWTPVGGASVVMAQGETLATLERRYGVPADALLKVNGIKSKSQVGPGTSLIIPVYDRGSGSATAAKASVVKAAAPAVAPVRTAARSTAQSGGNVLRAPVAAARPDRGSRKDQVKTEVVKRSKTAKAETGKRDDAAATRAERLAASKAEQERKLAERRQARKEAAEKARQKREELAAKKAAASRVAKVEEPKADVQKASVRPADREPVGSIDRSEKADASGAGNFRWPARGRVIRGYVKGQNDGINIAVPEGSAVKAAEGGVVAYAGSELKGYGNLVLIKHPNGYVSAYAHNSAVKVKRGDKVRRGQTIAAAGRTGNVSTPQIHFELRKGAEPVNPVKLLGSN
ncbi:MAG: peptidoglycan DD-metalloendopeptidase family protein [Beijerinckiaceae bacterium]